VERPPGLASGIINLSMQVSAALGLATLGTIATNHTNGLLAAGDTAREALLGGYHLAFAIGAICVAVAALVALATIRPAKAGAGRASHASSPRYQRGAAGGGLTAAARWPSGGNGPAFAREPVGPARRPSARCGLVHRASPQWAL
jgi:hypothetical protein